MCSPAGLDHARIFSGGRHATGNGPPHHQSPQGRRTAFQDETLYRDMDQTMTGGEAVAGDSCILSR